MIAIYGLSPRHRLKDAGPAAEPSLFERHYTPDTRSALPAIELSSHEPLLGIAATAGFEHAQAVALETLRGWETSPGSDLPYALVAHRPSET